MVSLHLPIEFHSEDPPTFLTWLRPPQGLQSLTLQSEGPRFKRLLTTPPHSTPELPAILWFQPPVTHTSVHLGSCFRAMLGRKGGQESSASEFKGSALLAGCWHGRAYPTINRAESHLAIDDLSQEWTIERPSCPRWTPYINLCLFSLAPPTVQTSDSWTLDLCVRAITTHIRASTGGAIPPSCFQAPLLSGFFLHILHIVTGTI